MARILNRLDRFDARRWSRFPLCQGTSPFFFSVIQSYADDQAFFPKIKMGPKWDAFGQAMKHKGLPLIIMIRYSPIPWAIGNGLFAVS